MGSFLGRAFILQPIWNLDGAINELPNEGEGLHCSLPPVPDMDHLHEGHDSIAVKILLHFANYFFPLFTTKGGRSPLVEMSGSLSRSQLAAIHYVTEFIQSRYNCWVLSLPPFLSLSLSLSLYLSPSPSLSLSLSLFLFISFPLPLALYLHCILLQSPPFILLLYGILHNMGRYKSLSEDWSQFLKVWPGYIYWARGQLKLAANAFVSSLELLKHCMQVL